MPGTITILPDWEDRGADVSDDGVVTRRRSYFALVKDDTGPPQRPSDLSIIEAFSQETGIVRWSPLVDPDGTFDETVRCQLINVRQTTEAVKHEIRVTYTSVRVTGRDSARQQRERAAAAQNGEAPHANPTQRGIALSIGSQEYEEALEVDAVTGQPVWNSARERFVPPIMRSLTFRVITLERNELLFDSEFTHQFENTVNAGTFYTYGAGKVLCKSITASLDSEGRIPFWKVTYTFWVRPKLSQGLADTWEWKQLDAGLNKLDAVGKPIAIRDAQTSQPVSSPRPLDGAGGELAVDADPVYLPFNLYPATNFTLLGLGG